jgi:hypothetical protein
VLSKELIQLQDAVAAASWNSPLSNFIVLPIAVGDVASPFTKVPLNSCITDPAWAAESSAAAAAKPAALTAAAAAASAAVDSKAVPPSPGAGKAASNLKAAVNSSTGRAVASAGGSSASAAGDKGQVPPEEVLGCKELARGLLTVRNQAQLYDQWRAAVRVYHMPQPATSSGVCRTGADGGGTGMSYYQHLLSRVPSECQSVPVVLHALLEQVRHLTACCSRTQP